MEITNKEHYELMQQFERDIKILQNIPNLRLDREKNKELWKHSVYEAGETNQLFIAYRAGYSLGKSI